MNLSEEIVDYLRTQGVANQKGLDIFYSYIPDTSADSAYCVRTIGGEASAINQPNAEVLLQVITRGSTADVALTAQKCIRTQLHALNHQALTVNYVVYCMARSEPRDVGPDKLMRHLYEAVYFMKTYSLYPADDAQQPARGGNPDIGAAP